MKCFALYWSLFKCWVRRLEPRVMQGEMCSTWECLSKTATYEYKDTGNVFKDAGNVFSVFLNTGNVFEAVYIHMLQFCEDTENTFPDTRTTHSLHSSSEAIVAKTEQQHMWQDCEKGSGYSQAYFEGFSQIRKCMNTTGEHVEIMWK